MKYFDIISLILLAVVIIVVLGVSMWVQWSADILRPRLEATGNLQEGFMSLDSWLPTPDKVSGKQVCGAGGPADYNKDPFKGFDLLEGGLAEPRIAKGPTAQECYTVDYKRTLERAGSYGQRTNNYQHKYPDSCNAWNQDLVLTFYKNEGAAGAIQV